MLEAWILEPLRLVGFLAAWLAGLDWIGLDLSAWQMGGIGGMEM